MGTSQSINPNPKWKDVSRAVSLASHNSGIPDNQLQGIMRHFVNAVGGSGAGSGRFVSSGGDKVVRMGESDITGSHGGAPHMNFEILEPNPLKNWKMRVKQNMHIFLED